MWFVGDVGFISSLLACSQLPSPERTDAAAPSLPSPGTALTANKVSPKLFLPTRLCLAVACNLQPEVFLRLSRHEVSPPSGFTRIEYHRIHIADEQLANLPPYAFILINLQRFIC